MPKSEKTASFKRQDYSCRTYEIIKVDTYPKIGYADSQDNAEHDKVHPPNNWLRDGSEQDSNLANHAHE